MARLHHVRVRRAGLAVPAAASCVTVAMLMLALVAGCAPAPAAVTSSSRPDPVAACGRPSTPFATFWYLTAGSDQGIFYQGTFQVGSARVPSSSMYVSDGPPGRGMFCVSAEHGAPGPIQSTAAPRPGSIAYTGATGNTGDIIYFATRPGVTRVTMDAAGTVTSYTVDGSGELKLQSLGNGWHAAGSGYGIWGGTSVTLRAYNSAGQLTDTVTQPITSQPPPAAATTTST
jgi:hypothetical protein